MKNNHLAFLTWLRALAAMLVVVDHSVRIAATRYFAEDPVSVNAAIQFFDIGTFAVDLFFALSGCTLYISYSERLRGAGDAGRFYVARIFRIWPAFAFSLLVYLLFIEFFKYFYVGGTNLWIAQFLHHYSLLNVIQYLSLTFNFTGPRDLFIGPYWSLPVEFQYYLLLPIALLIMRHIKFGFLVPLVFGAALYFIYQKHSLPVNRYEVFKMGFTFFGGVLLAHAYTKTIFRMPFRIAAVGVALMIFGAGAVRCGLIGFPDHWRFVSDHENLFGLLGLGAVMFALFSAPVESHSPAAKFFSRYGEISYSVYLFHMLFVGIAALLIMKLHMHDYASKFLFAALFTFALSYMFSNWSYNYIEKPSMEMGRRLSMMFSLKNSRAGGEA